MPEAPSSPPPAKKPRLASDDADDVVVVQPDAPAPATPAAPAAPATPAGAAPSPSPSPAAPPGPAPPPPRDPARADKLQRRLGAATRRERAAAEAASAPAAAKKYTPLEQQVLRLWREHPGTLLVVEVGYKMRLFEGDAVTASEVCNLWCGLDHNFKTTSFPVHRTEVYVRRLVEAGHRVGLVQQVETAALKRAGGNRGAPFERRVTAVYTRSTVDAGLGELFAPAGGGAGAGEGEAEDGAGPAEAPAGRRAGEGNYLACVAEAPAAGPRAGAELGLVAVEVSCGEVLWDAWTDVPSRSELEARVLLCNPSEVLIHGACTDDTVRAVKAFVSRCEGQVRVETVQGYPSPREASDAVASALAPPGDGDGDGDGDGAGEPLSALPGVVKLALAEVTRYLEGFKLEGVLRQRRVFRPLSDRHEVLLSPNALDQLEVLRSSQGTARGSLLWVLDHTRTPAGARLLRRWAAHPMKDRDAILARLDAVQFLRDAADEAAGGPLAALPAALGRLPDLDRGLTRILHGTASPSDFVGTLRAFGGLPGEIGALAAAAGEGAPGPLAALLGRAAAEGPARVASSLLSRVHEAAAGANSKVDLFADEASFPRVFAGQAALRDALGALDALLPALRRRLGLPGLQYKTVQNQGEFLIEVPKRHAGVPKDWELVCSTKAADRFMPPEVKAAREAAEVAKERLQAEAEAAWRELLAEAAGHFFQMRAPVRALAELDALLSLAHVARLPGYVRPEVVPGDREPGISIRGGRHPALELTQGDTVPNDCALGAGAGGPRAYVVTGPNMGGKSCFLRMTALLTLMAHIGSFVPADAMATHAVDGILCRMGAGDGLARGTSTFAEECQEAALILRRSTERSLLVLDELGRGTSTHDGAAIAEATLRHLVRSGKGLALFVTHYNAIASLSAEMPDKVRAVCMSYLEEPGSSDRLPRVTFLYRTVPGVAPRSFGLHVASIAGVPAPCVERAAEKAEEFEGDVLLRLVGGGREAGAAVSVLRGIAAAGQAPAGTATRELQRATAKAGAAVAADEEGGA